MPSHQARHRSILRTVLALCFLLALFPAAPVSADAWNDVGGGVAGGNTPTNPEYLNYRNVCVDGAGWREALQGGTWVRDQKIWDAPFSQCVPGICPPGSPCTLENTYNRPPTKLKPCPNPINPAADIPECPDVVPPPNTPFVYCQTHWEVWRFYGTISSPVQSYSVSRVNLRDWCVNEPVATFFSPHPNDAGVNTVPGASNPFARASFTNTMKEKVIVSQNAPANPYGTYSTNVPFRRSGACTVLNSPESPYADGSAWATTRLDEMFNAWRTEFSDLTARSMTNVSVAMAWNDGITCSSGTEFARTKAFIDANPQDAPAYGVCWVQVERRGTMFTNSARVAVLNWPESSIHRYSDSGVYTAGAGHQAAWRRAIRAEVLGRPGPLGESTGSELWVPGEPYTASNTYSKNVNKAAAANAAAFRSQCEDGPLSNGGGGGGDVCIVDCTPTDEVIVRPAGPSILYTLVMPRNFLIGGGNLRQNAIGVASDYQCNECAWVNAPIRPYIDNLNLSVTVNGIGNFKQYRVVSAPGNADVLNACSISEITASFDAGNPSSNCSFTNVLEFFRASELGQSVRVTISGSGSVVTFTEKRTVSFYVPTIGCPETNRTCWTTRDDYPPIRVPMNVITRIKFEDQSEINLGETATAPVVSSTAVWR